jgi:signal transduction histidine kinase
MDERQHAELTAQILSAEQDERRRIALFLHDGPVQSLAGIALMLDAALHFIEHERYDAAREVMVKALDRHRITIGELRDLSFNLEPVVLRDQGFSVAVRALADGRAQEHGIRVEVRVEDAEQLDEQMQAALFEIAREALDGAVRRGPPTTFSVVVERLGEGYEMSIVDDAPTERRRRSVEVLEERARTLGGTLDVEHTDAGTRLTLRLRPYG